MVEQNTNISKPCSVSIIRVDDIDPDDEDRECLQKVDF
jgi:hypothetical protein